MRRKKRIVFLLGAGAAYNWFTKDVFEITTKSITEKIRNLDPICCEIENLLKNNQLDSNFESVINVVENLFYYYYGKDIPISFDTSLLYSVVREIEDQLPANNEDRIQKLASIFQNCIELISEEIRRYDEVIKQNAGGLNDRFINFLKATKGKRNIIRAYSLNYDNMFMHMSKKTGIKFFDGFEKIKEKVFPEVKGTNLFYEKFNSTKVIEKRNFDCFFNLHGNINWEWRHFDKDVTNRSQFYKNEDKFNINWDEIRKDTLDDANPNEKILLAPIITGYKKLQRINHKPFHALNHAFYSDCQKADVFIFVGYSFGDPHINRILSDANFEKKKVLIVDFNNTQDLNNPILTPEVKEQLIENGVNDSKNIFYFKEGIAKFLMEKRYYKMVLKYLNKGKTLCPFKTIQNLI